MTERVPLLTAAIFAAVDPTTGGGQVIAQGTPEQVAQEPGSHTGRFLAEILGADDGHGA